MRKTISLLVLLLMMVAGANSVSAQTAVEPSVGYNSSYKYYEYYVYNVDNSTFVLSNETSSDNDVKISSQYESTDNLLRVKLASADNGNVYIMQANISSYNAMSPRLCYVAAKTSQTDEKLHYMAYNQKDAYQVYKWKLQKTSDSNDYTAYYNIVASDNDNLGWKTDTNADNLLVRLSTISGMGFKWRFVPANDAAKQKLIDDLNNAKAEAQSLLDKVGVGYPTAEAQSRKDLQAAMEESNATAASVNTAIAKYKSSLKEIQMPVDGKVYKIYAHYCDGTTEQALYWDSSLGRIGAKTADQGRSSYFFCHKVGDKYLFVNKDGKYLNWFDSYAGNASKSLSATGATDAYNADANLWAVSRATIDGFTTNSFASDNAAFFGLVQMNANGASNNTYYLLARYNTTDDASCDFVSGGSNLKCYDDNDGRNQYRTFAFHFEEVDCTPLTLRNDSKYGNIGTYSTPFPVTLPDDMTAYYAASYDGGESITLTEIEGTNVVLPEQQGFVIVGQEAGSFTLVPATEDGKSITLNYLKPTNGDSLTVESPNAYILTQVNSKLAYYKLSDTYRTIAPFRSYLEAPANASSIQFDFGSATGISSAVSALDENSNAPVFDLSGRRVSKPAHGVYIKNGKKFIVK